MPKRKRAKKAEARHTHISARVMSHEMHAIAGINSAGTSPEYNHWSSPDDPVYEFTTGLTILSEIIDPAERLGHGVQH